MKKFIGENRIKDIFEWIKNIIPTKVSQLDNDEGYVTSQYPVSLTNNLMATEEGTALDAVQGKVLGDRIAELNNNMEWNVLCKAESNHGSSSTAITLPESFNELLVLVDSFVFPIPHTLVSGGDVTLQSGYPCMSSGGIISTFKAITISCSETQLYCISRYLSVNESITKTAPTNTGSKASFTVLYR